MVTWEAVYSPAGPDGYPTDIWDPMTGSVDKTVAQYWKENYDIRYKPAEYLKPRVSDERLQSPAWQHPATQITAPCS